MLLPRHFTLTVAMADKPATPAPMTSTLHGGIYSRRDQEGTFEPVADTVTLLRKSEYVRACRRRRQGGNAPSSCNLTSEVTSEVVRRFKDRLVTSYVCHGAACLTRLSDLQRKSSVRTRTSGHRRPAREIYGVSSPWQTQRLFVQPRPPQWPCSAQDIKMK